MTTYDRAQSRQTTSLHADILIVTVTPIEVQAVLDTFQQETGQHFERHHVDTKTYYELGTIASASVFMVQSEMGVGGPNSVLLTVEEAIRVLSPSSVIMVGIAFGFDDKKFAIGDILVSEQLWSYEQQKIATDNGQESIIFRGDRPHASPKLLNRFKSSVVDWSGSGRVEIGLLLSGEKLIDNREFRDKLLQLAPEALGGEMEGFGLYAAASLRKTDWVLVKAICDWADGNKSQDKASRQRLAAENASRFVMHVLQQEGFVERIQGVPSSLSYRSVGTTLYTYTAHSSWVVGVDWSPNGAYIASAAGDGTVRIWEPDTGHTLMNYLNHILTIGKVRLHSAVHTIHWSPKELEVASGGNSSKVHVWNALTGQIRTLYEEHSGVAPEMFTLAWSPDGTRIASVCSGFVVDKTIHVWSVEKGQTIKKLNAHSGLLPDFAILSLVWSPDSTRIAASIFGEKAIRIWNVATGQQISTISTHAATVSRLAWSHDGRWLASAHSNGIAQVWDIATGERKVIYREHTANGRAVAWSPDDNILASASDDRTVHLWEAATGKRIYVYKGHSDWTTSVSWSPDGNRIASASNDKTVQIWQAKG